MERHPQQAGGHHETTRTENGATDTGELERISWWPDYDRIPAHGKWLYVAEKTAWDEGQIHGAWIPAALDGHTAAGLIGSIRHQPLASTDLVIIDQVGIETMVDEDHFAPAKTKNPGQ